MPLTKFAEKCTRVAIICVVLLAVCLVLPASAQRKSYTLDNDPYRLGNKALSAGNLEEATTYFCDAVANDHRVTDALCGLAVVELRLGKFSEAEGRYRQALAASGGHHKTAQTGLGLLLLRQGRNGDAAAEFDKALEDDSKLWEAHYGLARIAMDASLWDVASEHLKYGEKKRGLDEGEDKFHYGTAVYLMGTEDITGAERSALRAQVLNPTDPVYAQLVAHIYKLEGQEYLALSAYEQALATPGFMATAPLLHEVGLLYAEQNRFNEASERYLASVTADSTYAPAFKDLASLYRRGKRYDRAAGTYLRYLALEPADSQAQLNLSECFGSLGRNEEAAGAARLAWKLEPNNQATSFQFARTGIMARTDSLKAEAAELMSTLLQSPTEKQTWQVDELVALATWQSDNKKREEAIATLNQAAELAPKNARIPFQQGLVALAARTPEAAIIHFQQAVTLEPENAANHLNLGIARYQAGKLAEATPAFRQAVTLRPKLAAARLLLAQVLAASGSISDAEKEYRQVLTQEPKNAKALRGLGFCLLRSADYNAAAATYAQATDADVSNADGWAGLGSARLGQGNLEEADAAFAKAKAINPQNIMLKTGTQLLTEARNTRKDNQ